MHEADQLVFTHDLIGVRLHLQLRKQRTPAGPDGDADVMEMTREPEEEDLLPVFSTSGRLPADAVQLDAAEVAVAREPAATPADDHRSFEETGSALLERVPPSEAVSHRQLPAHIQPPARTT